MDVEIIILGGLVPPSWTKYTLGEFGVPVCSSTCFNSPSICCTTLTYAQNAAHGPLA